MKTPEEIKKELDTLAYRFSGWLEGETAEEALAYINQLEETVPRWISMKERLPTEKDASPYGLILCVLADSGGIPSNEIRAWHWENIVSMDECFTHWMPLPDQPKES